MKVEIQKGDRYSRLTVLREVSLHVYPDGRTARRMRVQCDCGKVKTVFLASMRQNRTRSCGCFSRERAVEVHTKHGACDHPGYFTYVNMMKRCYDKTRSDYCRYGGRGIRVCSAWRNAKTGLLNFTLWWDENFKGEGLTLDRRDNDKGYSPNNCIFRSAKDQARNRGNNLWVKGKLLIDWYEKNHHPSIKYTSVISRIQKGWSLKAALMTPPFNLGRPA